MREFFRRPALRILRRGRRQPAAFASQSWHLEQLGWTGILIEPQPDLAAALRQVRTARVFAVACSSPRECRPPACRCMSPARCRRSIAIAWRPEPSRSGSSTFRCGRSTISWPRRRRRRLRSSFGRRRRPRARSAQRLRLRALAAAADPARGSRRESRTAPVPEECRLPPDPPLREQRLVCAESSAGRGRMARALGDRAQILSGAAVSDRAQWLADGAPAVRDWMRARG